MKFSYLRSDIRTALIVAGTLMLVLGVTSILSGGTIVMMTGLGGAYSYVVIGALMTSLGLFYNKINSATQA
jgi:hypothetical protein